MVCALFINVLFCNFAIFLTLCLAKSCACGRSIYLNKTMAILKNVSVFLPIYKINKHTLINIHDSIFFYLTENEDVFFSVKWQKYISGFVFLSSLSQNHIFVCWSFFFFEHFKKSSTLNIRQLPNLYLFCIFFCIYIFLSVSIDADIDWSIN